MARKIRPQEPCLICLETECDCFSSKPAKPPKEKPDAAS